MQSLSLAGTVTERSGPWEVLHVSFCLYIFFALKTEATFLGRLEPTRKHLPDGIFL